jgi:hypothetical protein
MGRDREGVENKTSFMWAHVTWGYRELLITIVYMGHTFNVGFMYKLLFLYCVTKYTGKRTKYVINFFVCYEVLMVDGRLSHAYDLVLKTTHFVC